MSINIAPTYYVGDDIPGTFTVSVTNVASNVRPSLSGVVLRLIGKRSLNDPDSKALFDSTRVLRPLASVVVDSNDGTTLAGRWEINGAGTWPLRGAQQGLRPGASPDPTVPLHCAFTATYAGRDNAKVLWAGIIYLLRDRVADL
jgi:hypothetical protein